MAADRLPQQKYFVRLNVNLDEMYEELDRYIRTGEIEDMQKKERIDHLHKMNLFKLQLMPCFEPTL